MLKRKDMDIPISFKRRRAVWASESFCEDDSDSTLLTCCIPGPLLKYLIMKGREAKGIPVAFSIEIWFRQLGLKPGNLGKRAFVRALKSDK